MMYENEKDYKVIIRDGIKMINAGGLTHPGGYHIDSPHYNLEIDLFNSVLDNIEGKEDPIMIEVGSFWAWWSLMFRKRSPRGRNIIVEYAKAQLRCGEKNFEINGYDFVSYHAGMGIEYTTQKSVTDLAGNITLEEIIADNKLKLIDILHMDIQGSELAVVKSIRSHLTNNFISNIVIATHGKEIHAEIVKILLEEDYEVVHSLQIPGDDGQIYARARV